MSVTRTHTASVQSTQTEACVTTRSACPQCHSSLNQVLLQLWQNEVTWNS